MSQIVRIGTRDSKLATWQAEHVAGRLQNLGVETELVFVKSEGDLDLTTPLHEMGGKGVFTKALDEALLNREIDLAVHSFKDLPTQQPLPLRVAAVLKREDPRDGLVAPSGISFLDEPGRSALIATSSNRRRAQWLHRYPDHEITNIRGNVQTRLRKVQENDWDGAIFAVAGLKRVGLDHHISANLDWMVPAPAQGAVAVMIRSEDDQTGQLLEPMTDEDTRLCTGLEREVLARLEAGCSAPLGAYSWLEEEMALLHAVVLTLDGRLQFDVEMSAPRSEAEGLGFRAAEALLEKGAKDLVEDLRK